VHDLSFSPDGSTLAISGGSPAEFGDVELWSWPTRVLLRRLEGHDDLVYDAAWLGDGKHLATASADRRVRVWETDSGRQLASLAGHSGPVRCLAVSPDGSLVCSGSADQTVRVWNTNTWQLARTMTNHLGAVHDLAFRPDTEKPEPSQAAPAGGPAYLASAAADSTVRIWQPAIGRMVRIIRHPAPVFTLAWRSDGRQLLSGGKDGVLRLLDPDNGAVVKQFDRGDGWLISLALDRRSDRVAAGDSQGSITVLRLER
jgi:WD40 repeat protein